MSLREGLTPRVVRKLANTISDINEEGITVFLVKQSAGFLPCRRNAPMLLGVGKVVLDRNIKEHMADENARRAFLGSGGALCPILAAYLLVLSRHVVRCSLIDAPAMSTTIDPPSTTRTAPVTKDESSLAKKTQAPAISLGPDTLPRGT